MLATRMVIADARYIQNILLFCKILLQSGGLFHSKTYDYYSILIFNNPSPNYEIELPNLIYIKNNHENKTNSKVLYSILLSMRSCVFLRLRLLFSPRWLVFSSILFTKLSWRGDSEGTFRSSSQAATCPPVYHTRWRLYTVPLIADHQAGKLWIPIFVEFGLTRSGIEPVGTVSVADALSTWPLIGFIGKISIIMEPEKRTEWNNKNCYLRKTMKRILM